MASEGRSDCLCIYCLPEHWGGFVLRFVTLLDNRDRQFDEAVNVTKWRKMGLLEE